MSTTVMRFGRSTASVPEARAFARGVLRNACAHFLDDVLVCVSELATNAVRHGVPVGGAFLIKIEADDQRVRVECHDANRRRPRVRHPADDDQHGRGLLLVEAISSRWGVGDRPFGKYVWFELDLRPPADEADRPSRLLGTLVGGSKVEGTVELDVPGQGVVVVRTGQADVPALLRTYANRRVAAEVDALNGPSPVGRERQRRQLLGLSLHED
ncbi:ATP-binding protein [Streptomyces sp. NPDC051569]|uniref:ATP-binding protein n=1 Tax=Streptomyces sp. NPDC051569 TaxID=3365661 RepID=UPI0037B5976E